MTSNIDQNIRHIREQIGLFERKYARANDSVQLLAVSKTRGPEAIRQAYAAGQRDFGENYLQEALEKQSQLDLPGICWHFIGPLHSNKTRAVAEHFDWVHSVDREKTARRLGQQRPRPLGPLKVLLQVNLSGEASKSGVSAQQVPALAAAVAGCPGLNLQGLMAIPAPVEDFEAQRAVFRRLAGLRDRLQEQGLTECRHLSMGMSRDYEAAIAEGATVVRIGTDIFGPR